MNKEYTYDVDISGEGTAARFLRLAGKNKVVLEMGCSTGSQTRILSEQLGCSVTAVEINPEAAAIAEKYSKRVIIGNIEQIDFSRELGGDLFDVIMFADVLEHLKDPVAVLTRVKPFLSGDGYIIATVPNFAHASIAFELANGRFNYRNTGLLDDTHIRFFTRQTIFETFDKSGFQIVALERGFVKAEDSEFETKITSPEDRAVLDYIRKHNPESETYHFIVKAILKSPENATYSALQELRSVEDLSRTKQAEIIRNEEEVRKLKSELNWITSARGYKLLAKLKRIVS